MIYIDEFTRLTYGLIRQSRYIDSLFQIYKTAEAKDETTVCRTVALILKLLISIDQKPDITLTLINERNYKDFFACLSYLDENSSIEFDLKSFFTSKARFNNFLQIDNSEILSNINNNFRIVFLKDFIFPTFLNDKQLDELNTFLLLHNNTIICHINSVMKTKMAKIDELVNEAPDDSFNFFNELFIIFKTTFVDLKMSFINNFIDLKFHLKLVALVRRLLVQQPNTLRDKKLQVCFEILFFLCRNSQKALVEIFEANEGESALFLEYIPSLLPLTSIDLYKDLLDIFGLQSAIKTESSEGQFKEFL